MELRHSRLLPDPEAHRSYAGEAAHWVMTCDRTDSGSAGRSADEGHERPAAGATDPALPGQDVGVRLRLEVGRVRHGYVVAAEAGVDDSTTRTVMFFVAGWCPW